MTQILPVDDDFAAGTPTMGQLVCLYLGCNVTISAISGLWRPAGVGFIARPMHAAYQSFSPSGVPDYNSAFFGNATARSPSGTMFRRPFAADCVVTGTFEMRSLAGGAPNANDLAPRGVMARISGGTIVGDGTADVRYRDVDCYMAAVYQKDADGTFRASILRWNAGAFTVLSESAALPAGQTIWTAPNTVTLSVSGTGATVTLVATFRGFGGTGILTLNASDSSGSRITAAGRAGYMTGPDRVLSGKTIVDLCHLLAVDEGATRILQDEFRRFSLAGAKQTGTDAAGTPGSGYLSSAYFWDAGTYDGTDVAGPFSYQGSIRLKHSSSTSNFDNQVTDDDLTSPTNRHAPGRLIIAQRPADSYFSQHRTVSIIMPATAIPTASTGEVWAGIALRANQAKPFDQKTGNANQLITANPNVPGGSAYVFALRAKTSTQVIWELRRILNNAHAQIATKTENSPFTGAFPGYGNAFTLELDVRPRDTAAPYGVVEIICKVNGSLLAFDTFLAPLGITNPSTGKFHDGGTARLVPIPGEGLFVCNGFLSSGSAVNDYDPIFDSWAQGTLSNIPIIDQEEDTIPLATEPVAVGQSLDAVLSPDWPYESRYESHHLSIPFESGHRQTMPRFLKQGTDALIRRQQIRFLKRGATRTEIDALQTHWDAHDGVALGFTFTPKGESALVVHYKGPIRRDLIGPSTYEVEFELEELK